MILDSRGRRPDLLEAIPARFRTPGFAEGDEIEKELGKERQRSVSLRPAALKHYGRRCQYPGCEVIEDYKLDVHHLNPISQGAHHPHRGRHRAVQEPPRRGAPPA